MPQSFGLHQFHLSFGDTSKPVQVGQGRQRPPGRRVAQGFGTVPAERCRRIAGDYSRRTAPLVQKHQRPGNFHRRSFQFLNRDARTSLGIRPDAQHVPHGIGIPQPIAVQTG